MKTTLSIYLCITITLLSWSCTTTNPFSSLHQYDGEIWSNRQKIADSVAKIFNDSKNIHKTTEQLYEYLDKDIEKHYWSGVFLSAKDWCDYQNKPLAIEVLKKGLALLPSAPSAEHVRFNWVLGKELHYKGYEDEAAVYLVEGYSLGKLFQGSTPAFASEEEYELFNKIIMKELKQIN